MKKVLLALMVATLSAGSMMADDITANEALKIANDFVQSPQTAKLSKTRPMTFVSPKVVYTIKSEVAPEKANVYVINLGSDQGFVLVSGETGTDADILGYCDHGSFDYENAPVQLKGMLKNYSKGVDLLRQKPQRTVSFTRGTYPSYLGNVVVEPLLTTTWSQWAPYNNMCPEGCPTGCVPTAYAQVLYYYRWPDKTVGTLESGEDFSGHTYDWDNMLSSYDGNYTGVQANAVAKLMADIGKACGTIYANGGSTTGFSPYYLVKYFNYQPDYKSVSKDEASQLIDELKAELDENRPVLYSGNTENAGEDSHAMVCDGYTSNDYFHFNYGWGGAYDGFYKNAVADIYNKNASIITFFRPYDATHKVIDNIEYGLLKDGTADVLEYKLDNVSDQELIIPATVKDDDGKEYKVTHIRKHAFYNKGSFSKVVMGENIEVVDPFAFIMSKIGELVLSDKMENVSDEAFQLSNIHTLTIGASVKRIGKRAFMSCPLTTVICKSEAFEVDDEAFMLSTPDCGDWMDCITSLGTRAFANARFDMGNLHFAKLESIGSEAFYGDGLESQQILLPKNLKYISPDAFKGAIFYGFEPNEENPYFTCLRNGFLLNKNQTSLVMTFTTNWGYGDPDDEVFGFPKSMVKMEPGSVASTRYSVTIPNTVIQLEGAFKNCDKLQSLTCLSVVPPAISDDTFSDALFENNPNIRLYVPEGCAEQYSNAPGWRRFTNIFDEEKFEPLDDQGRQYYMVVHGTDESDANVNIPVSDISQMTIDDATGKMTISRNGKADLTSSTLSVDSITWMPGFVYENAEVFNLNDSTLTAEAQKLKVAFDPTVIDGDVQLCVRNLVLEPKVVEEGIKGMAFDLSLSNGQHELTGTAEITVPISLGAGEELGAAYYNENTGMWDPVYLSYDKLTGQATITTNHLSTFCVFMLNEQKRYNLCAKINRFYYIYPPLVPVKIATNYLKEILTADDPQAKTIQMYKDLAVNELTFSIDGLGGIFQGQWSAWGYESVFDKVFEIWGHMGLALTLYDVLKSVRQGDEAGVASKSLSVLMGVYTMEASKLISTPIMTTSLACVAFVNYALNKMGTIVTERKYDLFNDAYRYFYTKQGSRDIGGDGYRSARDWYNIFFPLYARTDLTEKQLNELINKEVRSHCEKFWTKNEYYAFYCEKVKALTSFMYPDEATKNKITDDYYADLMNGTLVSVFTSLLKFKEVDMQNRVRSLHRNIADQFNSEIQLHFYDSTVKEGEVSKYAGWKLVLDNIPSEVTDPEVGTVEELSETGEGRTGFFTMAGLLNNNVNPTVTLYNKEDVAQKTYTIMMPLSTVRRIINIDLVTGGTDIEAPELNNLILDYTYDNKVPTPYTLEGPDVDGSGRINTSTAEVYVLMDNSFNKKARFQEPLERYFKQHDYVTVDGGGNFKIGEDIVGKFENNGLTAKGKFNIKVKGAFTESSEKEFVKRFNDPEATPTERMYNLLRGTVEYEILDCEYTITRKEVGGPCHVKYYADQAISYLDAEIIEKVTNFDWNQSFIGPQHITLDDITVGQKAKSCMFYLKYETDLE